MTENFKRLQVLGPGGKTTAPEVREGYCGL
jgi:hypothetical protein